MGLQHAFLTVSMHNTLQNGLSSTLHEVLAICRPELTPAEEHGGQQLNGFPHVSLHEHLNPAFIAKLKIT